MLLISSIDNNEGNVDVTGSLIDNNRENVDATGLTQVPCIV